MQRIGLFGGTFDPPHLGHLIVAGEALDSLCLDRVLWILTPQSPLKNGREISPADDRVELLRAALSDTSGFEISLVDVNREPPYYAVDTVRQLKKEKPDAELIYIMGGDSLLSLPAWYQAEELVLILDGIGVYNRPGSEYDMDKLDRKIPGIKTKVTYFNAPQIEISSADIRQRIRDGRIYKHFLKPEVFEIIKSRKYYR